jgi:predicted kinase
MQNFNNYYFKENQDLPDFVMLIGIPGSGKSHWIKQYNTENKYRVISPDEIRKEFSGNISDQSQNDKVWKISKQRVINSLRHGKSVILDATNTSSKYRKDFIQNLPNANLKAKVFYVDPEIAKQRIKKDIEDKKDRANVPDDVIDRMQTDLLHDIKFSGGKVVDASKLEDEGFQIIEGDNNAEF